MSRRRAPLLVAALVVALVTSGLGGASNVPVGVDGVGDLRPVSGPGDSLTLPSERGAGDGSGGLTPRPGAEEGVRVGVIGSSFDRSHPALDDRVNGYHYLGDRLLPVEGDGEHDTAVAEVIADRSDDAGLYLVSVGQRPTPREYDRAVEWLLANEVNVIVDAGSYFPSTAEGMTRITTAAERAADSGAVFITSAGNYGQRHWRGVPSGPGWASFGNDTEGNRLGEGPVNGTATLRLYWEGDADYDLYLYRDLPGRDDPVVGKSTRRSGNAEAIDATLSEGRYYVGVYARDPGTEPVDLFSATHSLEHTGTGGSAVAPATAEGVIAVGAVTADGRIEPYSSAADVNAAGDVSTDAAGRLSGTSAAAPLVAGTVIRMEEVESDGDLTSAEVERILRETADEGSRRVDPAGATASVGNATAERR